jgi:hypothetical protein
MPVTVGFEAKLAWSALGLEFGLLLAVSASGWSSYEPPQRPSEVASVGEDDG